LFPPLFGGTLDPPSDPEKRETVAAVADGRIFEEGEKK
jgi:hypothetical protein